MLINILQTIESRISVVVVGSLTAGLLSVGGSVLGQRVELSPIANYHFGGKWNLRNGDLKVNSSDSYGASLSYSLLDELSIEALWIRQDSQLRFLDNVGTSEELFDVVTEYINIGIVLPLDLKPITPFFSVGYGVVVFSPESNQLTTETRMSGNFTAGVKYFLNDKIGFRIQTQMLVPIQWGSAGVFCGSGGCSGAIEGTTTVMQGTVGGGIVFVL